MLPDWETLQKTWPLRAALAALWARIEVARALGRAQVRQSAADPTRLEARVNTMETVNDAQRQMLEAAARRPADRDAVVRRLRNGRF